MNNIQYLPNGILPLCHVTYYPLLFRLHATATQHAAEKVAKRKVAHAEMQKNSAATTAHVG